MPGSAARFALSSAVNLRMSELGSVPGAETYLLIHQIKANLSNLNSYVHGVFNTALYSNSYYISVKSMSNRQKGLNVQNWPFQ